MSKIHTTVGLYPNGSFKMNGVPTENLEGHIKYNIDFRWGRALFIDGLCYYKGLQITDEEIAAFEQKLKEDKRYTATKDTQPYV